MKLFKRNNKGIPQFWEINDTDDGYLSVSYGIVGKNGMCDIIQRTKKNELESRIKAKRKEGYKELKELHDNAPEKIENVNSLINYLYTYLPKFNTGDGVILPMLAKTLENNKPFTKSEYRAQYKINGERCIISATKSDNIFNPISFRYISRTGTDWTKNLKFFDTILNTRLSPKIIDMMIEEGACLDGELYIPNYSINQINHIIKDNKVPQHYQLQYWLFDICIPDYSYDKRDYLLKSELLQYVKDFQTKKEHLNNKDLFIVLNSRYIYNYEAALTERDKNIELGFEGLVCRDVYSEYQFGKRNQCMFKFKKILDGNFEILDVVSEGKRRSNLAKFVLKNDINEETFECTINMPHDIQEEILKNKEEYIGKYAFVEYRERSGVKQVPFHAKVINISSPVENNND